jgi:hypothetical protein
MPPASARSTVTSIALSLLHQHNASSSISKPHAVLNIVKFLTRESSGGHQARKRKKGRKNLNTLFFILRNSLRKKHGSCPCSSGSSCKHDTLRKKQKTSLSYMYTV